MYKCFLFSTSWQHLTFVFFLLIATLRDVQWQLIVILICTSLMISNLFKCLLTICISSLEKYTSTSVAHFFPLRECVNAVPLYHKLCSQASHVWRNQRGQHIQSAMGKSQLGQTTFVIMVSPLPGKYPIFQLFFFFFLYELFIYV